MSVLGSLFSMIVLVFGTSMTCPHALAWGPDAHGGGAGALHLRVAHGQVDGQGDNQTHNHVDNQAKHHHKAAGTGQTGQALHHADHGEADATGAETCGTQSPCPGCVVAHAIATVNAPGVWGEWSRQRALGLAKIPADLMVKASTPPPRA